MGRPRGRHVLWAACPCPLASACLRSRVASHLGVMAVVAAVMGVVVAGLAIPFAGVLGIGAKSLSHTVEDLPGQPPHASRSRSRRRSSTRSATPSRRSTTRTASTSR